MSENMTVCPDCGAPFDTIGHTASEPREALRQQCPDCDYTVDVAVLSYPSSTYEVIAPTIADDDGCTARVRTDETRFRRESCGDPPTHRVQQPGHPVETYCIEHVGAHRQAALDLTTQL